MKSSNPNRTQILFGPPGTGKTTALLETVEKYLAEGGSPSRVAFCSFTRQAANEARQRAMVKFPEFRDSDFFWFRTLHSTAFRRLGLRKSDMMSATNWKQFGEAVGVRFLHRYGSEASMAAEDGHEGDIFLRIYSLARAWEVSLEEAWRRDAPDIDLRWLNGLANDLRDFKREYALLDFTDLMRMDDMGPMDVDLFILDEAQDLTPQQWSYAKRLGAKATSVVLAGDDDQAIFDWAGADVARLRKFNGHRHVLPQSFRIPSSHKSLIDFVASNTGGVPKVWRPREEVGTKSWFSEPEQLDVLNGESWLLLCRHRSQLKAFEEACRLKGVVYSLDGKWSNQTDYIRAILTFETLRKGNHVSRADGRNLVNFVSNLYLPEDAPDALSWQNFSWPFSDQRNWMDALDLADLDDREYVRRLRQNDQSLIKPGCVRVSTVHGAKGSEADNVALMTDLNMRSFQNMWSDPAGEHRVAYVGVSRSRKNLYIQNPRTSKHWSLP